MTPLYRLDNVVRNYQTVRAEGTIEALRVPTLEIAPGEALGVVGPNGSGKSTLLETLAFLTKPDEGRLLLDGGDAWAIGRSLYPRRRCPMLLQRSVLFKTSVVKNVMYGLRATGMPRPAAQEKAESVLRLVQLDRLAHRTHRELSGGERQRVALARILALEPDVLLLDEPTAHVDQSNARLIEELIQQLHATTGMTVILASHDLRQAQTLADRVVTLLDGQLFEGTIDNLFTGTLQTKDNGFTFRGENDLLLRLNSDAIVAEQCEPFTDIPIRIALDPERLEIQPGQPEGDSQLSGSIESVHQHQDKCRIVVRLRTGQEVTATLPQADYSRLGLNIDSQVGLCTGKQATRIIQIRARKSPTD